MTRAIVLNKIRHNQDAAWKERDHDPRDWREQQRDLRKVAADLIAYIEEKPWAACGHAEEQIAIHRKVIAESLAWERSRDEEMAR